MTNLTINIAPSWKQTAHMLLMLEEHGDSPQVRQDARNEIIGMGSLLDKLVTEVTQLQERIDTLEGEVEDEVRAIFDKAVESMGMADPAASPDWRYLSACPEGHDTVLGFMAQHFPDVVDQCWDATDTQRDGFWLGHRCRERGIVPVKVAAPQVLQEQGIHAVNAYPVDMLRERML